MLKNKLFLAWLLVFPLSACFSISPWSKIREYSGAKSGGDLSQFPDLMRLAEGGLAPAQYNLGDMYLEGKGVQKDESLGAG